ncbi:hypothetical protein CPC16_002041 [Podila verticillata]|nr:hypothetical protein BGZ59_004334 [Podila verticillata]KAF9393419.1 hypothetical protein CPC16_002041 [Podila verticillata]KAI9241912.1 MAG: hypothetical protein BYD32DRAFT_432640 [Podila humilis]
MADHTTTTTRRPATTSGSRIGTATGTATSRPTNSRTSRTTTLTVSSSATITTTATPTPEPAAGLSGGVIGGIAGGVVVLFALVAFVIFKRRKRAAVANSAKTDKAGGTGHNTNAMSGPISGPMALAPEKGIEAAPDHRPEAKFREQQQFHPAMRDELFATPGAGLQNSKSKTGDYSNKGNNTNASNADKSKTEKDYYDDPVSDYFGDDQSASPIGAQRSAPQPRDLMHGNLTPAPEYYLGKEDIDPRRDLRGMDTPDTYVEHYPTHTKGKGNDIRRSSLSSDGGNAHMTPDLAHKAHSNKMIGHKESIGSVQMLLEHSSPTDRGQDRGHGRDRERDRVRDRDQEREMRSNGPRSPGFASDAVSESTVSMMPALSPTASPMPFKGQSPPRHGPNSPVSPRPHEDPYAESAFSSEDFDSRSLVSGPYSPYGSNNHDPPRHHQSPPFHPSQGHGYGHQPFSPPFPPNQYPGSPPFHPNGRPQQPPRGPPLGQSHGHGYGHGHHGPPHGGPPSPGGGYYGGGPPRGYNHNHQGHF